jgi:hypothetical protein
MAFSQLYPKATRPTRAVVRAGDLCQLPHGDRQAALAFHVRDGVKCCERHAFEIDLGPLSGAPVAA